MTDECSQAMDQLGGCPSSAADQAQQLAASLRAAAAHQNLPAAKQAFDGLTQLCAGPADRAATATAGADAAAVDLAALAAGGVLQAVTEALGLLVQAAIQLQKQGSPLPRELADVLCAACDCIVALAADDGNLVALGTHGAAELMAVMLQHFQADREVIRGVGGVLRELLCSKNNSLKFTAAGGGQLMWQTLVSHLQYLQQTQQPERPQSPIWDACCYLLRIPSNQQLWFELSAIPVIAQAFEQLIQNETVIVCLGCIIMELCRGNLEGPSLLGELGICASISRAMSIHEDSREAISVLCGALVNLALLEENKLHMVRANCDVAAVRALAKFGEDPAFARRAARMLTVVCAVPGRIAPLAVAEGHRAVMAALRCHLADALIVEPLCRVVMAFGLEDTDANVRAWGQQALGLLIEVLAQHASSPDVLAVACGAMSAVLDKQNELPQLRVVADVAVCQGVFTALTTHSRHLLAFSGACRVVASLCNHPDHARWFARADVFDTLYQAMRHFEQLPDDDPLPLERAQLVWLRLINVPETVEYLRTHADVLNIMRLAIARNIDDRLTAMSFCNTVAAFALRSERLSTLCGIAGHCEQIVRVLETHITAADVVHWACAAIRHLCNNQTNQMTFALAGACQLLPVALSAHLEAPLTSSTCVHAVTALCSANRENATMLGEAGVVAALMGLLVLRLRQTVFVILCCAAFAALCHGNPGEANRLYAANIAGALSRIFETYPQHGGVVSEALRVIINLCEASEAAQIAELGRAGLCQAVLSVVTQNRESAEIVRLASTAILRLCAHVEAGNRGRFVDSGALEALNAAGEIGVLPEVQEAIQLLASAMSTLGPDE